MDNSTHTFRAETQKLLDIVIHSLYSNKEIFLRELISNASDALDRLRLEALTTPGLHQSGEILEIRLEADAAARTLSISDNGIGMGRQEVIDNLGTIAKSGTREVIDHYLEKAGVQPDTLQVVMELGSPEAIKGLLSTGNAFAIMSRATAAKEARAGVLARVPLSPRLKRCAHCAGDG